MPCLRFIAAAALLFAAASCGGGGKSSSENTIYGIGDYKIPWGLALNADYSRLFVANNLANTIEVYNTETMALEKTISVLCGPRRIAFNSDFSKLYVTHDKQDTSKICSDSKLEDVYLRRDGNWISVINVSSYKVISEFQSPVTAGRDIVYYHDRSKPNNDFSGDVLFVTGTGKTGLVNVQTESPISSFSLDTEKILRTRISYGATPADDLLYFLDPTNAKVYVRSPSSPTTGAFNKLTFNNQTDGYCVGKQTHSMHNGCVCLDNADCACPTSSCTGVSCADSGSGIKTCVSSSSSNTTDTVISLGVAVTCTIDSDCTYKADGECGTVRTCSNTPAKLCIAGTGKCWNDPTISCGTDDSKCTSACTSDSDCTQVSTGTCRGKCANNAKTNCTTNTDCEGTCLTTKYCSVTKTTVCTSDDDCNSTVTCTDGKCSNDSSKTCTSVDVCRETCNRVCSNNDPVKTCTTDAECNTSATCGAVATWTCSNITQKSCAVDRDCESYSTGTCPSLKCVKGDTNKECQVNSDCDYDVSDTCKNGACQTKTAGANSILGFCDRDQGTCTNFGDLKTSDLLYMSCKNPWDVLPMPDKSMYVTCNGLNNSSDKSEKQPLLRIYIDKAGLAVNSASVADKSSRKLCRQPSEMATDPSGRYVFVICTGDNIVAVINAQTGEYIAHRDIYGKPVGIIASDKYIFVSTSSGNQIDRIPISGF